MAGKEQLRLEKGSFWKLGAWKPGRRRRAFGSGGRNEIWGNAWICFGRKGKWGIVICEQFS
jgi:hypothetical protein